LRLAAGALICAAGTVAPISPASVGLATALAADCSAGAGPSGAGTSGAGAAPSGAAGTSALYGELASSVNAEPLSVDITAKAIGGTCTWVYEVKVLTVSGTVALLDFDLVDLDLKQVEGSMDDPEVAKLMDRLKDGNDIANGTPGNSQSAGDGSNDGNSSGNGSEGGSGGSGSGGGDGSDSGGSEGGSDGGGSEGGGDGGSDGGSDGGHSGDGGGDGGGEGGEGGGDD
jgi:hypothetical protein